MTPTEGEISSKIRKVSSTQYQCRGCLTILPDAIYAAEHRCDEDDPFPTDKTCPACGGEPTYNDSVGRWLCSCGKCPRCHGTGRVRE